MEYNDKQSVQNNINGAADDQIIQRPPGIPGCPQDSGSHIVYKYKNNTCKINPQIDNRIMHDFSRSIHQVQQCRSRKKSDYSEQNSACNGNGVSVMQSVICISGIFCSKKLSDCDGSAGGKTGKKSDHKSNNLGGGSAYAGERFFSHELSNNNSIHSVV